MIRIYLDWNVISNLKKPENEAILKFITEHKEHLLFLYSPAHFNDLMKSDKQHPNFQKDLENLEWLCGKHHIRWENDNFAGLFGTPSEYFDIIKYNNEINPNDYDIEMLFETMSKSGEDNPVISTIVDAWKKDLQTKTLDLELDENSLKVFNLFFPGINPKSSIWDLTKAFGITSFEILINKHLWLGLRKHIEDGGGKLEANAGNWKKEDVIKNVDRFINKISPTPISFYDYLQLSFKEREKPASFYELYQIAYLVLDLIGFKSDSLPKLTDGLQNITTDADHSFLAQACDIFVLEDKKMKAKTEALFHYFSINTKVIKLDEFVETCKNLLHDTDQKSPLQTIDYLFELYKVDIDQLILEGSKPFNKQLNKKLLNIFNFASFEYSKENKILCLTFSEDEFKYGNFLYFTEKEYYMDQIKQYFDYNEIEDSNVWRSNFIHNHNFESKQYRKDGVSGILWKDEKYYYPLLTLMVKIEVPTQD
jgi:hypothetical protein